MNKKTIGIIVSIVLIIIFAIIFFGKKQEAYFSKVTFNDNNYVLNRTNMKFADTIVLAGLHELKIKNVDVLIMPIDTERIDDMVYEAYIIPLNPPFPSKEKKYLIKIKDFSRHEAIKILSHELIHLRQMFTLKLDDNGKFIIWDGKIYQSVPDYFDRPWEIEAFDQQDNLKTKIKTKLYSNEK